MHVTPGSFAVFVYPFAFDRVRFPDLVAMVDQDRLAVGEQHWPIWVRDRFPQADLLPHVADYLNPPPGIPATACLWRMEQRVLTSPRGMGLRSSTTELLLWHRRPTEPANAGDDQAAHAPEDPAAGAALTLMIDEIDLMLFGVGMGYLLFSVRLNSRRAEDWFDVLNGFRYCDRPTQIALRWKRRTGKDRVEPYFPTLAERGVDAASGQGVLGDLIRGLLGRLVPEGHCWWRELFVPGQLLPFHALFFEGVAAEQQPLLIYRLRNLFRAGQALIPAGSDLRPDHPALLPYAEGMWFSLTLEGGGFIAFDAPETPFWSQTLPMHLREQYLLLFLLALHQRFTLMHLSEQVCARWRGGDDPRAGAPAAEARFADLREVLLEFTARGYFRQVMQREHHHRCFQAWQRVFETERLYQEVSDEVRELHGMLLMRKTEHIQRLGEEQRRLLDEQAHADAAREHAAQRRAARLGNWLGGIAFLLGLPSLVLGFLQAIGGADPWIAGLALLIAFVVGGLMMLVLHLWLRERSE